MSVDVVCAGAPFLDITFAGLRDLPALGKERLADRVVFTPGGLANVAVGLTRLGLEAVLWSPVGTDVAGRLLAELLDEQHIRWVGPAADVTPVSAILPLHGDRAFATVSPDLQLDREAIGALQPRAVVIDLPVADCAPAGTAVYAVTGDPDAQPRGGALPESLDGVRAVIVNDAEAAILTGRDDPAAAARALAERVPTAVVTLGRDGAVSAGVDGEARAAAPQVDVVDTNGAGDLFTAAYVWADLAGMSLTERLRLATLYASFSVRVSTPLSGALGHDEFMRLAASHDTIGAAR